jgi:hypothetical protein
LELGDDDMSGFNEVAEESSAASKMLSALASAQAENERKKRTGKIVLDNDDTQRGLIKKPGIARALSKGSRTSSTNKEQGRNVDPDGFLVPELPAKLLTVKHIGKEKDAMLHVDIKSTVSPVNGPVSVTNTNSPLEEIELEAKNKTVSEAFRA